MKLRTFPFEWLLAAPFALSLASSLAGPVIINEIHYDPDVKVEPVEFVELQNVSGDSIDLSGWKLTDAVAFTFPAGTELGAGKFVVVAQDPTALREKFGSGINALGPWLGRLANEGDTVTLQNAQGQTIDKVNYQLGFPWPTVGDPPGYSIELVNPGFDNDLGGNWRVSTIGESDSGGLETLVAGSSVWRYAKGTNEASNPTTAWRQVDFDDSDWLTGQAPFFYERGSGYNGNTDLTDMRNGYTCIFMRQTFNVANPAGFSSLTLDVESDDGAIVWLNGEVVEILGVGGSEIPFDGTADSADGEPKTSTTAIPASKLVPGQNVLAVQALNRSLDRSSDFWIEASLTALPSGSSIGIGPTPGATNAVFASNVPPQIRQVDHSPNQPHSGEPVVIAAKITDPEGVTGVELRYQIVEPGHYITQDDPEYETDWSTLPMTDDGTGPDEFAHDNVFSAQLPGTLQLHRRLIRYRISATDGLGAEVRVPYTDDPQPNFAYFVYDGVPAWQGSIRPGVEPVVTIPAEEMGRLPTYHVLSKKTDIEDCTWFERYRGDQYKWRGTLVYDGQVYDHVRYRARGGVWRYAMCKNMWKFRFNRGHYFQARDNWGKKYNTRWNRLNLGASIQQGNYNHRGEQGMFESVGFRMFNIAGVPAPNTTFATLRIIDEAAEVGSDQFEGDFWGVYLATEQMDGRFLDEHGLPDGNLYKMENGTGPGNGELKNQDPNGVTDNSDLTSWRAQVSSSTSEQWWRNNFDLPRYYSYYTIVQAIHHYDICCGKNYYWYFHPETGKMSVHPWDLDLTWADNMFQSGDGGTDWIYDKGQIFSKPGIRLELANRVREILDLFYNPDEAWRMLDEYARLLQGPDAASSILVADRAMWDYNPKMISSTYSTSPSSKAGQGRFYQAGTPTKDFNGMVQKMKNYVVTRSTATSYPSGTPLAVWQNDPLIPNTPTVTYTGPADYPLNRLTFRASNFSGPGQFASMQWRIGEVTDTTSPGFNPTEPQKYEIDALWKATNHVFAVDQQIPSSVVQVGHTYRARVRMIDTTGRTSHWSDPVQFVAGPIDGEAALVDNLRLTELMFDPPGGSEFEFIELWNRSPDLELDLDGVKFTAGIDFAFPPGTTMAPDSRLLVVKANPTGDFASFRQHYGLDASVPVVGPYSGGLANGGEAIVLKAGRAGTPIVSFDYGTSRAWPVAAQGGGHSMVPLARALAHQADGALDYPGNWEASVYIGGSPGTVEPARPAANVVLNELAAHTDFSDPARPNHDSNDWIELFNAGGDDVVLEDYFLSDDPTDPRKWRIPTQTLSAGSFVTFDEVLGFHYPITSGFGLDKAGEQVLLSHLPEGQVGRVVDGIGFKGQENERSYGRAPDGGDFWQALSRTRNTPNANPNPTVVISEIMYNPSDPGAADDNVLDEYVELVNTSSATVTLYDTNGAWRLAGGIGFDFPDLTSLGAGESLLVVNFDPADSVQLASFKARYGLTESAVVILGPYAGKLSNRSDRIGLEKPQYPDLPGGDYSWVVIDEVVYGNQDPWPSTANGGGLALLRQSATASGMNPDNWVAALPEPGRGLPVIDPDKDKDGMPDAWEELHGLSGDNPADADLDLDKDGATNLEEYLAGTDPTSKDDVLYLDAEALPTGVRLRFTPKPGKSYSILYRDGLSVGPWLVLESIPASPDEEPVTTFTIEDAFANGSGGRLYKLVTPAGE